MQYASKSLLYTIHPIFTFIHATNNQIKLKLTFQYHLHHKQTQQFQHVTPQEAQQPAFYFIEDLLTKQIQFPEL
uniref:hypothetical protein n=1 Tax=Bacillus thuringiensis TaxID=1428 RepID=UPI001C930F94